MKVEQGLLYQESHEWVRLEGDEAVVGISDFAQEELNDVVYVELPEVGDTFAKGDVFGTVESVKAASDLYLPLSGEIIAVNKELEDSPQLVNEDPYGKGWFVRIKVSDPDEAKGLLSPDAYAKFLAEEAQKGGH
ncbi:MAG: glycine cleavage system protein GcvH [Anaerolineae bacterium]|jgi:glycine cleavage system H protein|nr:glycine cleavage system protein GcvH [Anaerolineae bacterium]